MIRPAKILEIPEILGITKACMLHMRANGIFQWTEDYPSREAFVSDIENNGLYVYEENTILAVIALCTKMHPAYKKVEWLTPNGNNTYVHRLAVHPRFQGRGIARRLMDFAEDTSKKDLRTSIRLDTFSKNPRNQRFYEARGYTRLGEVYFPTQSPHPFYCYELVL